MLSPEESGGRARRASKPTAESVVGFIRSLASAELDAGIGLNDASGEQLRAAQLSSALNVLQKIVEVVDGWKASRPRIVTEKRQLPMGPE